MNLSGFISTLLVITALYSFSPKQNEISNCYINFNKASKLSMASPERLPATAEKERQLQTENGEVEVSRLDGYRVLYNNKYKVPFINVKVELSDSESYGKDTAYILENLKYLNSQGKNMETSDLIQLSYNGYIIYGLSRNTIEEGSTLGSFVMFPGNEVTVYFDFNNLKPEVRNIESLDDYKSQRNAFFGGYTSHLKNCSDK